VGRRTDQKATVFIGQEPVSMLDISAQILVIEPRLRWTILAWLLDEIPAVSAKFGQLTFQ
jgi:hypothetical protein